MDVLLLSADRNDPAGLEAVARLRTAGHTVHRCQESGAAAFPCAALVDGGGCPLDDIGAAVAVHLPGHSPDTEKEVGVRCALRMRLPVVSIGSPGRFAGFVHEVVDADGVSNAVQRAAHGPSPKHAAVVARELRARGIDAAVRVRREGRDLHVELDGRDADDAAAVHALAALRRFDPFATKVGVTVRP